MSDYHSPWNPAARTFGVVCFGLAGGAIWAHAALNPEIALYSHGSFRYSGVVAFGGGMMLATSMMAFIACVLMPCLDRKMTKSPLEIKVGRNELKLTGHGKHSGLSALRKVSSETAFSSEHQLIYNPVCLNQEVSRLLDGLKLRLKPFVVVSVDTAGDLEVSPSDRVLLEMIFSSSPNILDYRIQEKAIS